MKPYVALLGVVQLKLVTSAAAAANASNVSGVTCAGFEEQWGLCNTQTCKDTCVPKNCTFAPWDDWHSLGGCIGLCGRQRNVGQTNNECGTPCSGAKFETKDGCKDTAKCVLKDVDCKYTDWDDWATCSSSATSQTYAHRGVYQFPEHNGKPCDGDLVRTKPCKAAVSCGLSDWTSWATCSRTCDGGYTTRTRRVVTEAMYGGTPCKNSTSETTTCGTDACIKPADCKLGDWKAWGQCDEFGRRYRERASLQPATGSGLACTGTTKETAPCVVAPVNCELSEWEDWHTCSATCDGGQTFRHRHVKSPPSHGGSCPQVPLDETVACGTKSCNPGACTFTDWSSWTQCSAECGEGVTQRERTVTGKGCIGPVRETNGCTGTGAKCNQVDCKWADWGQWQECSLTCGGGEKRRHRAVAQTPKNGGKACDALSKSEVTSCNTEPCGPGCVNGTWADWQQWSQCTVSCDQGYMTRQREVATTNNDCGVPAAGPKLEIKLCDNIPPCVLKQNCVLGEWEDWSSCLPTCFGVTARNRVVKQYARGGGDGCVGALRHVKPCNPGVAPDSTDLPTECKAKSVPKVDCQMGDWSQWATCSATCGGGQKTRSRTIAVQAQAGGNPCNDTVKEIAACGEANCARPACLDCVWNDWDEWSACQGKCPGQRYRHRSLKQLPNYCGKSCDLTTAMETEQCQANCDQAMFCTWQEWSAKSTCPSSCGPHTSSRQRTLALVKSADDYLSNGTSKQVCSGDETTVEVCPYKPCQAPAAPVDCQLGDWSEWSNGTCSGLCERARVIKTSGKNGGKSCAGALSETKGGSKCEKVCEKPKDCILADWTMWSRCSTAEGQTYRTRVISQEPAFGGEACVGRLSETKWCTDEKAVVDCSVHDWSSWSTCEKSCGGGWQVRARHVRQAAQNGGAPCTMSMQEVQGCNSKPCKLEKDVDCELNDWSSWAYSQADGQKRRTRGFKQQPENDGKTCNNVALEEVAPADAINCLLGDWTQWDACDRPCNNGQHQRHRQVKQYPLYGGQNCPYPVDLLQVESCKGNQTGTPNCTAAQKCELSDWSSWGACSTTCGTGQVTRARKVNKVRGSEGAGCTDPLKETRSCGQNVSCPLADCKWGDWSAWGGCSKSCDGGERTRNRDISTPPKWGGKACAPLVKEQVEPCNTQKCDQPTCVDGKWGDWSTWGNCSVSCAGGVSFRHRTVAVAASSCGKPVSGDDREYKSCNENVSCMPDKDCVFGTWAEWDACSAKCDGVKRRSREIKIMGAGNGKWCEGGLKEAGGCNPSISTPGCSANVKQDCVLSDWSGKCTAPCGSASYERAREVKQPAKNDGKPCNATMKEVVLCTGLPQCPQKPVDCEYNDWSQWSACSSCASQRKRYRNVKKLPEHGGKLCNSEDTEQTEGCSSVCHDHTKYCTWQEWGDWGDCTKSCGSGKRMRRRDLHESSQPGEVPPSKPQLESLYKEYTTLRSQMQEQEARHFQDIAVAFVAGCVVFLLGLAVARISAKPPKKHPTQRVLRPRSTNWTPRPCPLGDMDSTIVDLEERVDSRPSRPLVGCVGERDCRALE